MRVPLHNDGDVLIVVDEYTKLSSVSTHVCVRMYMCTYVHIPVVSLDFASI